MYSFLFFIFSSLSLWAAPSKEVSLQVALQEMHSNLEQQNYQINAQKVELDLLHEKVNGVEDLLTSLKSQSAEASKVEKELSKDRLTALEKRISALEKTNDTLIADLRDLKNHINESSGALAQCKTKLNEIDKQVSQDIKTLKKSMDSVLALFQKPKDSSKTSDSISSYKVKPGDSLGKIAQDHGIDIKTLREINQLSNDKIIVGQTLKLPN